MENLYKDLQNRSFTDCVFNFPDGETLAAHKVVLSCCSPVFNQMFFGALKETSPISIPDIPLPVFRKLLGFIYDQPIKFESIEEAVKLYYAASKYDIPKGIERARVFMRRSVTWKTIKEVNVTADLFDDKALKEKCNELMIETVYDASKGKVTLPVMDIDVECKNAIAKYRKHIEDEVNVIEKAAKIHGFIKFLVGELERSVKSMLGTDDIKFESCLMYLPGHRALTEEMRKTCVKDISTFSWSAVKTLYEQGRLLPVKNVQRSSRR